MYTTDRAPSGSGSAPTGVSSQLLNRLFQTIERTTHKDPHPGFIIATHHFKDPYPMVNEIDLDLLCNATMDLLIQFAYPSLSGYGNSTHDPSLYDGRKEGKASLLFRGKLEELSSIMNPELREIKPIPTKEIRYHKSSYPTHITALKPCHTKLKPFIVADIETLLIDDVHKPYAAGLLVVYPGKQIPDIMIIDTYFSEDYSIILNSFEERSRNMLSQHKYKLKPLLRNNRLYELAVYSGKKMLFRFRDSLNLLPGKLSSLANNLCPELGPKGSIEHDKVEL
ncbi:UNVERIFIED_CONTAM: DNA polymerase [Sesamum angustifolium]|uniref:DNA-directed DNA polymerase n=1 Tax=Sesamum angustifolium TaxID=2727405 RepID=A0AAW2KMT4_9LAMI